VSQSKPRFHKQETTYSCVPACLRMVLSGFGLDLTEERLRHLCDCTATFGTDAWQAVNAARGLGFPGAGKYTLRPDELRRLVEGGKYPIAFISLEPINGTEESHAVVVVEVGDQAVGIRQIIENAGDINEGLRSRLVVNMCQSTAIAKDALEILPEFGAEVCETKLRLRTAYRQSAIDGQTVHSGGSRAAAAIEEVEALTSEVLTILNPKSSRRGARPGGKGSRG
jgi:hypothetical protein